MKIVGLELANFRRFRQPLKLDGFTSGLNVVVEPNESGKSTILEGMRAALFIRHSANTELTRSYCPTGDVVAPRVVLEFEIYGERWRVEKQFLRSSRVQLEGPGGRFESDAAEEQLQTLLGFERGNNKGTDPETRGALGLLWVEQASALRVDQPGRIVRDNVRSALEGEVGAITGGRRFDIIRENVEVAYAALRTGRQGRSTGRLAAAEARASEAKGNRATSEELAVSHEALIAELERCRTAKRLVEREIGDGTSASTRASLVSDLQLAESSSERLATAKARLETTSAEAAQLLETSTRIGAAEKALKAADAAFAKAALEAKESAAAIGEETRGEVECREALASARASRTAAETTLKNARIAQHQRERDDALGRARDRQADLEKLDREVAIAAASEAQPIAATDLERLKACDRSVIEARAVTAAGSVHLEIDLHDGTSLRIDGEQFDGGAMEVSDPVVIDVGDHASIRLRPPGAGAAKAALTSAEDALAFELSRHGVEDYSQALDRNARSKTATDTLAALSRQIATLCQPDAVIGLVAGPDALRALSTVDLRHDEDGPIDDVQALETEFEACVAEEKRSIGRHDAAIALLRKTEAASLTVATDLAGCSRDRENAMMQLQALSARHPKAALADAIGETDREVFRRTGELETAQAAAKAFDSEALRRRIANIDAANVNAADRRMTLIEKIAGLSSRVEVEGAKGLAGRLAEAKEEQAAADEALIRLQEEAQVLELLRTTLHDAHAAASRTFLGPVTRRAVHYVNRVLPGCAVTFSEELGLTSITRGGLSEGCADLSRGTQEQLAVLTRLAFADMLLDKGEPVSLVLDDPLVYSDDARLEVMTDILTGAADRMQIILLTCRERAFRFVGGTRVTI